MKTPRPIWMLALLVTSLTGRNAQADEGAAVSVAVTTNAPASVAAPSAPSVPWQERFTLEAGDVITVRLFGIADSLRENVAIGPDGRFNYLQATEVPLAGLTVDEARARLDEELARFIRNPRTVITPVAYNSKKYFVLGAVVRKGVYPFTRPISLLEAIANAGGLQTGLYERRSVEMADLQRSLLVRRGERITVDFEKLFQHGDLKQNVPLEPGDFLYFPPANVNEIYVLGHVMSPGIAPYVPGASAIGVVSQRGGFTPRAYKQKVLIVRGSLSKPETFIVDTKGILEGRAPDFKLQPRDIVFVSEKPWARAEDLLDLAGRAFVQAMVVTTVNVKFDALIKDPLFE